MIFGFCLNGSLASYQSSLVKNNPVPEIVDMFQLFQENPAVFIDVLDNFGYASQIIAAAIRNTQQMAAAAVAGAHCITAGFAAYQDSFQNPYTNMGERIFSEAWDATLDT